MERRRGETIWVAEMEPKELGFEGRKKKRNRLGGSNWEGLEREAGGDPSHGFGSTFLLRAMGIWHTQKREYAYPEKQSNEFL